MSYLPRLPMPSMFSISLWISRKKGQNTTNKHFQKTFMAN